MAEPEEAELPGDDGDDLAPLRAALAEAPDDWQASGKLGAALTRIGQWREAEPLLRAGVTGAPEGRARPWRVALAEAMVRDGRPGEALGVLEAMMGGADGSARAHLKLSRIMMETGNLDGAAAALQSAAAIDPESKRVQKQMEEVTALRAQGREAARMPVIIESELPRGVAAEVPAEDVLLPPPPLGLPDIGPAPPREDPVPSYQPTGFTKPPAEPASLIELTGGHRASFPQAADVSPMIIDLEPEPEASEAPAGKPRPSLWGRLFGRR